MTADEIRRALSCGKPGCECRPERGVLTHCPSHTNVNTPALTVRDGDTSVLVTCHNGCSREDVIAALKARDLWAKSDQPQREWRDPDTIYRFLDVEGRLVGEKGRIDYVDRETGEMKKRFLWRLPGSPKWGGLGGAVMPLYNIADVIRRPEAPVFVCYAPDTELLTPQGWVPFPDLAPTTPVAQYDDGVISFVVPSAHQEFDFDGEAVHIASDFCDLVVTPDHRMLVRYGGCDPVVIPASDMQQHRRIPVSGRMELGSGGPTAEQVRAIAAWQADGGIDKRGRANWNIKKERKHARLREVLSACGLAWAEHEYPSTPGWKHFVLNETPEWLTSYLDENRFWDWRTLNWPLGTRVTLLEELGYWDGDFVGHRGIRYFTAERKNAEVISALASVSGYGSILRTDARDSRPEQREQYIVSLNRNEWRMVSRKPSRVPYSGKVYCCTVPSGFLLVRRNGKTAVSGNCEGEKAVQSLTVRGLVAVCGYAGAGQKVWDEASLAVLEGRELILWPDNDAEGYSLMGRWLWRFPDAHMLRPDLPEKADAYDYFETGGTVEGISKMARVEVITLPPPNVVPLYARAEYRNTADLV